MAFVAKSLNMRAGSTLSAAALTIAALTLSGCGQLTAAGPVAGAPAAGAQAAPADGLQTPGGQQPATPGDQSTSAAPAQAPSAERDPRGDAGAGRESADGSSVPAPAAVPESATSQAAAPAGTSPAPAGVAAMGATTQRSATQPAAAQTQAQGTAPSSTRAAGTPGSYRPSASTAGVPAGTALKPYNTSGADLVITKDGTVLDGLDIYGDIKVRAKNVTIKNSRLHGGKSIPRSNTGVIDANSAAVVNLLVQDSTIIPDRPSYYRDGIVGHDYTARRNHIQGSNDGLGIFNRPGGPAAANVTAEANYIHSLTYFSYDPAHRDGTHNDGIQVQGGENIRIVGNNVIANSKPGPGSAANPRGTHAGIGIMLQQNVAKLRNVVVQDNWVDDGQTSINIDHGKYSNITVTVTGNKLGRNQFDFGNGSKYPVRIISRAASTVPGLSANRWADTGAALVEGRNGGIRYNR